MSNESVWDNGVHPKVDRHGHGSCYWNSFITLSPMHTDIPVYGLSMPVHCMNTKAADTRSQSNAGKHCSHEQRR